jgi:hypothetical protein
MTTIMIVSGIMAITTTIITTLTTMITAIIDVTVIEE